MYFNFIYFYNRPNRNLMKCIILIICLFFMNNSSWAQFGQILVEADADKFDKRNLIVGHNLNSSSSGLTQLQLVSGNGSSEAHGYIVTYNNNYTAIPDFHGYTTILSGASTAEGRGINFVGLKPYANMRFYLGGVSDFNVKMFLGMLIQKPNSK